MLASLLGPDHSRRDLTRTRPYTEMSAEAHLKRASDAYERALAVDPALWEPRLRYARVAHLLGRTERAEVEIARVLQHAPSGGPEYLARLIAGTVAEARGHPADAIAQYRRACYLCDECQSANLALSHALLRAGDQSSAVRVVDRLLELASPLQPNDPWWTYHRGQWPSVDALLQQVRKAVPR
jgi:tetratricopeptide (TPR) repeat protein